MKLTEKKFVQWTLFSITFVFATTFGATILSNFGYLHLGPRDLFTPVQLIGLVAATGMPMAVYLAYIKGSESVAGVIILSSNFIFPLFLTDATFQYSVPQAVWLPFSLALAICSIRWAILTFAATATVIFAFFPISDIQTPITTLAVTLAIFIMLTLGRMLQQSLTEKALVAEKAARETQFALRRNEERYRAAFQNTVDAISIARWDNGAYLEANEAFFEIFGFEPEEIIGQKVVALNVWESRERLDELLEILTRDGEVRNFEAGFRKKNGEVFLGLLSSRVIDIDGVSCRVSVMRDITERKKAEERINFLAYFDQLTRLPNRALLLDRLQLAIASNTRSGAYGALLLIDLDDFKTLNDTRGHESGDLLLTQVTRRLESCVRPGDTVARLGGDEFMVLLRGLGSDEREAEAQAKGVAAKISDLLGREFFLKSEPYRCTSSIGVCLFQGAEIGGETPLKQVELAMYEAKHAGRNLIRFFDPAMEVAVTSRAALEKDMRNALLENQFVLHYQAQIAGTQLVGAEVLARWIHPQRGMVSPGEFIPLAEETGLVVPLGRLVLETACLQLVKWGADQRFEPLTIAVNVSVQQFDQDNFVEEVLAVLERTGANPRRLKLELTESLMASDVNVIIAKMHALIEKGIRFSLDDFGTGYSSLTYLKRLPIDQLKIDQTFVRDLLVSPEDASIAKTIIELGENLGIEVIAEGVETVEHQTFLAELGCKVYQGYLFGRPMPITEFEQRVP